MKYSFSGHETFACKQYWLKKGIDYLSKQQKFSDAHAVIDLGVGKNMVTAIRFWLKAFGMLDENDHPTEMAEFLFGETGSDPYLEDNASLWLLHYQLIKEKRASIYDLAFNHFRYERVDFTKDHLIKFLERKIEENGDAFSPKTIDSDVRVFFHNYISTAAAAANKSDIEDGYSGVLQELFVLSQYVGQNFEGETVDWFHFNISEKDDLPISIILYTILDNPLYGNTISFRELMVNPDSPGNIFLLTESGLREKIDEITHQYPEIVFTETAGNQVLQIRNSLNKWKVLKDYYDTKKVNRIKYEVTFFPISAHREISFYF